MMSRRVQESNRATDGRRKEQKAEHAVLTTAKLSSGHDREIPHPGP
jgi:hypothetical protein